MPDLLARKFVAASFGVVCLCAVAAGLSYGALLYFWTGRAAAQQPVPPPPLAAHAASGDEALPSSVDDAYRALWTRLAYAEKDVSEMHDILGLTMILSAFFGIAVGVNAYLNLKQAQEELKSIHAVSKSARKKIAGIRAQFPSIAKMDEALEVLLVEVMGRFDFKVDVDWINGYYKDLPESQRQSILLSELTIAGFRFFDLSKHKTKVADVYHGLAIFYGSRYAHDRRAGTPDPAHRERALRYFEMVVKPDPENIRARKDRAAFLTLDDEDEAIREYKSIRSWSEDFPGIPLNLGILYLHPTIKKYADARSVLTELIDRQGWKGGDQQKRNYVPFAYYNRACAVTRLAESMQPAERTPTLAKAVEDVRAAFQEAAGNNQKNFLKGQLKKDVESGKDLELVKSNIQDLL